jgi:hypothetical protein
VPLSVQIGLLLSLATALASIVGFLYKHRGAVDREQSDDLGVSSAAFALVIGAAALTPPPLEVEEQLPRIG